MDSIVLMLFLILTSEDPQPKIDISPPVVVHKVVKKEVRKYIGKYSISRYYTPIQGQKRYYEGSYEADYKRNCSGDCLITSTGYKLSKKDEFKSLACPKDIKKNTLLFIDGIGYARCRDRGGSIKGNRLDIWTGIGDKGLNNILNKWKKPQPARKVYIIY